MPAPHQCAGAQGGIFGPPTLGLSITGPPCYDRYRQHHCCSSYQQTIAKDNLFIANLMQTFEILIL